MMFDLNIKDKNKKRKKLQEVLLTPFELRYTEYEQEYNKSNKCF